MNISIGPIFLIRFALSCALYKLSSFCVEIFSLIYRFQLQNIKYRVQNQMIDWRWFPLWYVGVKRNLLRSWLLWLAKLCNFEGPMRVSRACTSTSTLTKIVERHCPATEFEALAQCVRGALVRRFYFRCAHASQTDRDSLAEPASEMALDCQCGDFR